MNKILKSPNLLQRETPEALDRRILLAGAIAAAQHRRARRRRFIGMLTGAAAAVAVAVVATWHIGGETPAPVAPKSKTGVTVPIRTTVSNPATSTKSAMPERQLSETELLEFSDWTSLEQENYNLASQLNSYQDVQDTGFSS